MQSTQVFVEMLGVGLRRDAVDSRRTRFLRSPIGLAEELHVHHVSQVREDTVWMIARLFSKLSKFR